MKDGALIGECNGLAYPIRDDAAVLGFFREVWAEEDAGTPGFYAELSRRMLARRDFWGEDLCVTVPGLAEAVASNVHAIRAEGVMLALSALG
jgi:tagaturonate reductase